MEANREGQNTGKNKNSGAGCLIGKIGCAFMILLGIALFISLVSGFLPALIDKDTDWLPGSKERFDPISSYDQVSRFARSDHLLSLNCVHVGSNGTMDLTADYNPSCRYLFKGDPIEDEDDNKPVGAGGGGADWGEVKVTVRDPFSTTHVTRQGGGCNTEYTYMTLGLEREVSNQDGESGPAIPIPLCSFSELWETAKQKGAPEGAVATITYEGNHYLFVIPDTDFSLGFNLKCEVLED